MQNIDQFIDAVKVLPPAPLILPKLLVLLSEDDVDLTRVAELVKFDPALTAKVLQRSNSVGSGSAEPVHDIQEAAGRLGLLEIYRMVASFLVQDTLCTPQSGYGLRHGELWRHSVVTAVAAQVIARQQDQNEQLLFTAALLHDLGKLILSTSLETAYEEILRQTETSGQSFIDAEKAILGVEHAEIGGRLLQRWSFPENLVQSIWHHHDPARAQPHHHLAACINLADLISHFLGHGYGHQAYAVQGRPEVLEMLAVTGADLDRLILQTQLELAKLDLLNPVKT